MSDVNNKSSSATKKTEPCTAWKNVIYEDPSPYEFHVVAVIPHTPRNLGTTSRAPLASFEDDNFDGMDSDNDEMMEITSLNVDSNTEETLSVPTNKRQKTNKFYADGCHDDISILPKRGAPTFVTPNNTLGCKCNDTHCVSCMSNPPVVNIFRWCTCGLNTCIFNNPGLAIAKWPEWGASLMERFGSIKKIYHFGQEAAKEKELRDKILSKNSKNSKNNKSQATSSDGTRFCLVQTGLAPCHKATSPPKFWDCVCRRHIQPSARGGKMFDRFSVKSGRELTMHNSLLKFPDIQTYSRGNFNSNRGQPFPIGGFQPSGRGYTRNPRFLSNHQAGYSGSGGYSGSNSNSNSNNIDHWRKGGDVSVGNREDSSPMDRSSIINPTPTTATSTTVTSATASTSSANHTFTSEDVGKIVAEAIKVLQTQKKE